MSIFTSKFFIRKDIHLSRFEKCHNIDISIYRYVYFLFKRNFNIDSPSIDKNAAPFEHALKKNQRGKKTREEEFA